MKGLVGGMINAYAQKGVSELFERYGGRDFGDAYSLDKPISVDTLSISAQNAYMDMKNRIILATMSEDDVANLSEDQKKKFGLIPDDRSIWTKIGQGFVDAGASLMTMGKSFVDEFKLIGKDIVQVGKGMGEYALKGVARLGSAIRDGIGIAFDGIKSLGNLIGNGIAGVWNSAKEGLSAAWEGVKGLFGDEK